MRKSKPTKSEVKVEKLLKAINEYAKLGAEEQMLVLDVIELLKAKPKAYDELYEVVNLFS